MKLTFHFYAPKLFYCYGLIKMAKSRLASSPSHNIVVLIDLASSLEASLFYNLSQREKLELAIPCGFGLKNSQQVTNMFDISTGGKAT